MKTLRYLLILGLATLLAGCNMPPPKPQPTPLQVEAIQSKDFAASKRVAFDSVVTVFQDLGYIVQSADFDTGFITAKSPAKTSTDFSDAFFNSDNKHAAPKATTFTLATAFVSQKDTGHAHVRLNFVHSRSTSSAGGQQGTNDTPVLTPGMYQNAFNRIRQAIFVRAGVSSSNNKAQG